MTFYNIPPYLDDNDRFFFRQQPLTESIPWWTKRTIQFLSYELARLNDIRRITSNSSCKVPLPYSPAGYADRFALHIRL